MEIEEPIETFDIMVGTEKKGVAYDQNPIEITTDVKCKEVLATLMAKLPLTEEEKKLFQSCVDVVSSNDGAEFNFGPMELLLLAELAAKYPNFAHEILACSHHITASLDFEGDIPDEIFSMAADAHVALGKAVENVARVSLGGSAIEQDDILTDEEEEENSEDEEED